MKKIGAYLKKKITELRSQNNNLANRQQLAKCFGQYTLPSHPRLTRFCLFSDLRPAPYGLPARGGGLHRATQGHRNQRLPRPSNEAPIQGHNARYRDQDVKRLLLATL